MKKPAFSYTASRRPRKGDLVRNTGSGDHICKVVDVEGEYVWLQAMWNTNKGSLRPTTGPVHKHQWWYCKRRVLRKVTKEDLACRVAALVKPYDIPPAYMPTGCRYRVGGYWCTSNYRPVTKRA
jgi:hypothetical protein